MTKPGCDRARPHPGRDDDAERRPARRGSPHLYLAHGTGTDSAEMPFIGTDLGDEFDESLVLAPGMVMVLEPVIWDDGHGGFRAEEIVAVTDDGYDVLIQPRRGSGL